MSHKYSTCMGGNSSSCSWSLVLLKSFWLEDIIMILHKMIFWLRYCNFCEQKVHLLLRLFCLLKSKNWLQDRRRPLFERTKAKFVVASSNSTKRSPRSMHYKLCCITRKFQRFHNPKLVKNKNSPTTIKRKKTATV